MKANQVVARRFGEPAEVLAYGSRELPDPGIKELLVRVKARPINPSDLIPVRGAYAHRIALPYIPGYEGVGVVEAVGAQVSPSLLGKRVLSLRGEGTWQEVSVVPADWAIEVPATLGDETASQLFVNPVTALLLCTEVSALRPDDWVIMNAGGSALGRLLAQLSRVIGFRLILLTRSDTHTGELRALGARHVVNASTSSARECVMEWTSGKGVDFAIDSVGGSGSLELLACTRSGGTVVNIGLLSGVPVNLSTYAGVAGVNFRLFHLRQWMRHATPASWQAIFGQLFDLIARKLLRLQPARLRFPLEHFRQAIEEAEKYEGTGKILLL